eukprot:SAG11_NODE_50_length_19992_cov_9.945157_18_plen_250_part_00
MTEPTTSLQINPGGAVTQTELSLGSQTGHGLLIAHHAPQETASTHSRSWQGPGWPGHHPSSTDDIASLQAPHPRHPSVHRDPRPSYQSLRFSRKDLHPRHDLQDGHGISGLSTSADAQQGEVPHLLPRAVQSLGYSSLRLRGGGKDPDADAQKELRRILDNITAVHETSPSFRRTTDVDIDTFNITFRALAGRSTEADLNVIHRGTKRVGFNGEWPLDFKVQIEAVLVSLASSKKGKEVGFQPDLSLQY